MWAELAPQPVGVHGHWDVGHVEGETLIHFGDLKIQIKHIQRIPFQMEVADPYLSQNASVASAGYELRVSRHLVVEIVEI